MPTWEYTSPFLDAPGGGRARLRNPVFLLCVAHVAGFALPAVLSGVLGWAWIYDSLALTNAAVERFHLWQLLTYGFVHMPEFFVHLWVLVFSTYMLYVFGNEIRAALGARRTLAVYFAAQAYGGLVHLAYQQLGDFDRPLYGLYSVPVLGLVFYASFLWPQRSIMFFFLIPMSFRLFAWLVLGLVLVFSVADFRAGTAPVAGLGAIASSYLLFRLDPLLDRWLDRWEAGRVRRRAMEEYELRRRVDAILDKISLEGMDALTREERSLLKRASELLQDQKDRHD